MTPPSKLRKNDHPLAIANSFKLYHLMQISIAQQGGEPYVLHTHTLTKKTDNLHQTRPDFMWRVQKII